MKISELFESEGAKKFVDKDGKTVHRLPRTTPPKKKDEPTTTKATKRGPVMTKLTWQDNPFIRPPVSELYGQCNYDKRIRRLKDGERPDSDIVGDLLRFAHEKKGELFYFDHDGKVNPTPMATVSVVGHSYKQHPMYETWVKVQTLELHFKDGSIIPATRLGPTNVIVQDYRFKAYMPSGAKKFWSILRDHNNR